MIIHILFLFISYYVTEGMRFHGAENVILAEYFLHCPENKGLDEHDFVVFPYIKGCIVSDYEK